MDGDRLRPRSVMVKSSGNKRLNDPRSYLTLRIQPVASAAPVELSILAKEYSSPNTGNRSWSNSSKSSSIGSNKSGFSPGTLKRRLWLEVEDKPQVNTKADLEDVDEEDDYYLGRFCEDLKDNFHTADSSEKEELYAPLPPLVGSNTTKTYTVGRLKDEESPQIERRNNTLRIEPDREDDSMLGSTMSERLATLRNIHSTKIETWKTMRKPVAQLPTMKRQHRTMPALLDNLSNNYCRGHQKIPWSTASPTKNNDTTRKGFIKYGAGSATLAGLPGLGDFIRRKGDGERPMNNRSPHSSQRKIKDDENESDSVKVRGKAFHKLSSLTKKIEAGLHVINALQSRKLKLIVKLRVKLEKFTRWGPRGIEAKKTYRAVFFTRIQILEIELNMELCRHSLMRSRFLYLLDVYDTLLRFKNESVSSPLDWKIFDSYKSFEKDSEVKSQFKSIKRMRQQLKIQIAAHKKEVDKSNSDEGIRNIRLGIMNVLNDMGEDNIITTSAGQSFEERYQHERKYKIKDIWQSKEDPNNTTERREPVDLQRRIDAIILDQRTREGKQMWRLISEIQQEQSYLNGYEIRPADAANPLEAYEITDFIKAFIDSILTRHKIPRFVNSNLAAEDISGVLNDNELRLHILFQRTLFPLIYEFTFTYSINNPFNIETLDIDNDKFIRNQRILRTLSPNDIPVDFGFLPPGHSKDLLLNPLMNEAISDFDFIVYQLVPIDMVYTVQKVLTKIISIIQSIAGMSKDIGADDIFPVFIFILIFSNIGKYPYTTPRGEIEVSIIHYLQILFDFLSDSEFRGEAGYCVVTLQAAVRHITDMEIVEEENIE